MLVFFNGFTSAFLLNILGLYISFWIITQGISPFATTIFSCSIVVAVIGFAIIFAVYLGFLAWFHPSQKLYIAGLLAGALFAISINLAFSLNVELLIH